MDNNTYKHTADEKIASFDCTYTSNHIRMLKILLQYVPNHFRRHLIIYIRFMELQQAFSSRENISLSGICHCAENDSSDSPSPDFTSLIRELLPYCSPNEEQHFRNIENMMNSFEQMKNMMEMMEMVKDMKDMFGDGEGGFDPAMFSDMMSSMGTMDGMDIANFFTK